MGFHMLCSSKSTEFEEVETEEVSDRSIAHRILQFGIMKKSELLIWGREADTRAVLTSRNFSKTRL